MYRWALLLLAGFGLILIPCSGDAAARDQGGRQDRCRVPDVATDIRPEPEDGPTEVSLGVRMVDLMEINDVAQTLTGEFAVRQRWRDPRLAHLDGCLVPLEDVWSPGLIFATSQRMFTRRPEQVEVNADGSITYLQIYYGTMPTYHNLRSFPFDRHIFELCLLSPMHPADEVEVLVDEQYTGRRGLLNISDWNIGTVSARVDDYFVEADESVQSRYLLRISAERVEAFYIWKVILPLCLIVAMSWTVFWIDPVNFGPQIGLSATSMLTLIAFMFATTNMVPKLGYPTTLDLFTGGALILVFVALLQSLWTIYLVGQGRNTLAKRVDRFSRVVFPVVFAVFAVVLLRL